MFCAPDGASGVLIRKFPLDMTSFTIPGLVAKDTRVLGGLGSGTSGVINPAGDRAFARVSGFAPFLAGAVHAFSYDSNTAALGAAPVFSISPAAVTIDPFGIDQMALHPDGTKLYVPEPGKVSAFDASTGAALSVNDILVPAVTMPTGICFATPAQGTLQVEIDIKPGEDTCITNNGHGVIPVAILGSAGFDVQEVDPATVMLEGLSIRFKPNGKPQVSYEDVNFDGFEDLVVKFEDVVGAFPNPTTGTVTGELTDGTAFEGSDSICIN